MIEQLSVFVVGVAGTYLVVLGVGALVVPAKVARFLLGFASTQALHFAETLSRVIVGASLIIAAPSLSPPSPFNVLGWLLLATSALLLLVRCIGLVGIASLAGGVLVLVAVFRGLAS